MRSDHAAESFLNRTGLIGRETSHSRYQLDCLGSWLLHVDLTYCIFYLFIRIIVNILYAFNLLFHWCC